MKKNITIRGISQGFFILLITLFLLLLIFESVARFFEKNPEDMIIVMAQRDYIEVNSAEGDIITYGLKPGSVFSEGYVKINSLGFRDKERDTDEKRYRIAAIGDSITFGVGVGQDETYPYYLEKIFAEDKSLEEVEVWNMGVPAYNAFQKNILVRKAIDEFNADMILYQYFVDDYEPNAVLYSPEEHGMLYDDVYFDAEEKKVFSMYMPKILGLPKNIREPLLERSAAARFFYSKTYNLLHRFNPEKYPENAYRMYKRSYAEHINVISLESTFKKAHDNNISLVIFIAPILEDDWKNEYYNKEYLFDLIERYNTSVIDMADELKDVNLTDLSNFINPKHPEDDTHPIPQGNKAYAEIIAEIIYPTIPN